MRPLITGLLKLARALGKWIIEHLVSHGITNLIGYVNGKIGDFLRRKKKTELGRRLLRGRIRRWSLVLGWLKEYRNELEAFAVDGFCAASKKALDKIPMVSKAEKAAA
jgi:hypothetical protein